MTLQPGNRLGPYEIQSPLGAGGMGEVYRATDTRLKRDVALKLLPESFARDLDRLARFQREAEVLASLNHPNIAAIYGVEESNGTRALVMELVEGPTLADRIAQGPIPLDETLAIAKQIAEAFEAAHERGIIHRDLKPANIKVRPDGTVKVLDFGLAKALEPMAARVDATASPTITSPAMMTGVGALLGTAAYMSPEQARGKAVDKRSDIWAFGAVLFEMLTGRRAFGGAEVSDTLAAVSRDEPDWRLLPTDTPAAVRRLLRRCLRKDAKERLHDISDARIEMQDAQAEASQGTTLPVPVVTRHRERLAWAVAAVVVVIAAVVASVAYFRRGGTEAPAVRFTIAPPETGLFSPAPSFLAVSPDGSKLAFIASEPSRKPQLWIRALDSLAAQPLPGTDGATNPFWSPDGRFLAFYADGSLKKIAVSGGPAQTLAGGFLGIAGGTWSHDGVVLFAQGAAPPITLYRVSAAGGAATRVTTLDTSRQEVAHAFPDFLPDGKHFLYSALSIAKRENDAIYMGSLDSKERTLLLTATSDPVYSPPGFLIYHREGTLMAQRFDAERIQLTGEPVPIAERLQFSPASGRADFAISKNGVLAYRGELRAPLRTLVWVTRSGAEQPLAAAPARYYGDPRVSPDGRRVVVQVGQQETQLWVYDLARDTLTRLTFEGSDNQNPVWTPDGKRIAFESNRDGVPTKIFWQLADGSGGLERLTSGGEATQIPSSWSADGQLLAFHENHPTTRGNFWVLRLSDRKAEPFLRTSFDEGGPRFSPDGRWLAYASNESGRPEVYVQPYPGPGGKWQISVEGGTEPVWSRNGRELFYRSGNKMMAVETTTQPGFSAGKPRLLFEGQYVLTRFSEMSAAYDVSPDGQRFLMLKQGEQVPGQITVVQHWTEELKRRAPTN
jgi:eukaryotic-like serine/threonine-protein kinase